MADDKKIAVLGWGSLIWDKSRNLCTRNKEWNEDGPYLPIEFARKSRDGRITLVIYDDYMKDKDKWIKTLWNTMAFEDIEDARKNLMVREECSTTRSIGFVTDNIKPETSYKLSDSIDAWRKEKGFYGVIWTALEPNGLSLSEVLFYLEGLRGCIRKRVMKYIVNTPNQVQTPLLEDIERAL